MKICFTASSGGHLDELMMLEPIIKEHNSYIFTEKTSYQPKQTKYKTYYTNQINRKGKRFFIRFLVLWLYSFFNILKERPDVIITTGALVTYPLCVIGRFFGIKIIFIESISRIKSPTLTGKKMYKIADSFIVQWEELLEIYPEAIYGGGIF